MRYLSISGGNNGTEDILRGMMVILYILQYVGIHHDEGKENGPEQALAPHGAMSLSLWDSLCEQARSLSHRQRLTPTGIKPVQDENCYRIKLHLDGA